MHTNQIEIGCQKYMISMWKWEKKIGCCFWAYDTYDSLFGEGISKLGQES